MDKKRPIFYRQGDVYFFLVDPTEVPKNAKPAKSNVVALGEITGHRHEVKEAVVTELDSRRWVVVEDEDARVEHLNRENTLTGEHWTVALPVGVYEIRIQREYTEEGDRWAED